MSKTFVLKPVGHVRGGRSEIIDDNWGASRAWIELDPTLFKPDALAGLEDFSHLEVLFLFDRVADEKIEYGARRPRGRPYWPLVGIFAQRGKNRPNRLGLCSCRVLRIEGLAVEVDGLDAVDGTPVLDLKPVMTGFLPRGEIREPAWAREIMEGYW
jgi:tRNA (Thr-GGU) A37 N-methylase